MALSDDELAFLIDVLISPESEKEMEDALAEIGKRGGAKLAKEIGNTLQATQFGGAGGGGILSTIMGGDKETVMRRLGGIQGMAGAAGGISGGVGGSQISSIIGAFGGPVAAAVSGAAMAVIKAPFDAMAGAAQNAASELRAFTGQLGIVGAQAQREINKTRKIPVIGGPMASKKEAELRMKEMNQTLKEEAIPAVRNQRELATESARVSRGLLEHQRDQRAKAAGRWGMGLDQRPDVAEQNWEASKRDTAIAELERRMSKGEQFKVGPGFNLSPAELEGMSLREMEKIMGHKAVAPLAPKPAHFTGVEDYHQRLAEAFASQTMGQDTTVSVLKQILEAIKSGAPWTKNMTDADKEAIKGMQKRAQAEDFPWQWFRPNG